MKNHIFYILSALTLTTILSGCIDESYNLDNINKDIAITWETLSAPIKDKEIIEVRDIFNFDHNGTVITTDCGDYHIFLPASSNSTSFTIEDFTYEPIMKETYISEIPAKACDVEVEMEHCFTLESSDIPSEVKSIERIEIDCTVKPTFTFTKTSAVRRIIMKKGSELILPKWMVVGEYDTSLLSVKNNIITIIKDFDVTSDGMSSILKISAIDFTKISGKAINTAKGNLTLEDSFTTVGHIVLLQEDITETISESHFDVSFRCDISSVKIKSIKATLEPEIKMAFDDIAVNEFTSLFPKENTVNLYDVTLGLDIENNTPLSTNFSADLNSVCEGSILTSAHIGPLSAQQNTTTSHSIGQSNGYKVDNLIDIINSRPDVISIANVAIDGSNESVWVETNKTYSLSTHYSIDAPISFKKDLNYKFDHEMNMDIKLKDATIDNLTLTMNAVNSIPIGLKMTADILDKNGEIIPGAKIEFDRDINPGTLSNNAETPLKIVISPNGNIDYIKSLRIHFTGFNNDDTEGVCLNENQALSLVSIKATVNGMNIQLN